MIENKWTEGPPQPVSWMLTSVVIRLHQINSNARWLFPPNVFQHFPHIVQSFITPMYTWGLVYVFCCLSLMSVDFIDVTLVDEDTISIPETRVGPPRILEPNSNQRWFDQHPPPHPPHPLPPPRYHQHLFLICAFPLREINSNPRRLDCPNFLLSPNQTLS